MCGPMYGRDFVIEIKKFFTREEKLEMLRDYKASLENEARAIELKIKQMENN